MTNSNRSEISLDTSYLPCGFAYIRRHSDNTPCKVFRLAAIVHFGLLSPPCAFPGIQIIRHSAHRFFALSSTASYLLSGSRQPSHPARIFSGIFPDPFYLLPAHVTLMLKLCSVYLSLSIVLWTHANIGKRLSKTVCHRKKEGKLQLHCWKWWLKENCTVKKTNIFYPRPLIMSARPKNDNITSQVCIN